jgi:hypothetical protein
MKKMSKRNTNPLFSPQREKSGPTTYSKYQYQYNWGLSKVLSEHESRNEYAVFVELHEDVVTVDSFDSTKAKFEFNQVKTDAANFTITKLTKLKNGSSVLGKLLDSCLNKSYSAQISCINLIAVNGFGITPKDTSIQKEKLCITEIEQTEYEKIENKIKSELGITGIPDNLYFVIPVLPDKGFEESVIGQVSVLVNSLFPSSQTNSIDIYRTLIDEMNRKGTNTFDYEDWEDALNKKALTSVTISRVINTFTNPKNESNILIEFESVCSELNIPSLVKRVVKKGFNRYRSNRIGNKDSNTIKVAKEFQSLIDINLLKAGDDLGLLIQSVIDDLSSETKSTFKSNNDLKGALIYEYIIKDED